MTWTSAGALLLILGMASAGGNGRARREAEPQAPPLTVCQVLSDPLRYDGLLVTIRGRVSGTREGGWLLGMDCPGVFVTEGHVWDSDIWLETPEFARAFDLLHPIDFEFDEKSNRKMLHKYKSLGLRRECVLFTYTGLFETRSDWSTAITVYPNGERKFVGFGHLNGSPARLVMKSANDVTAVPDCGGKRKAKRK